jgi:type III restriction enzyme
MFNLRDRLSTAPCVAALREAVKSWRDGGYKGVTRTTFELLNYWFETDHPNFRYYDAQREAIEALMYVYEVKRVRSRTALLEQFALAATKDLRLPPPEYDAFARYAVKMATGSGKTIVMALAIVWQYANAIREDDTQYAKTFLVLAPNVIVFERLRRDFEGGRMFQSLPLFPMHFKVFWDLECYMRGDTERTSSTGALYLTNIQQFYERAERNNDAEPDIMTAMLGAKPQTKKVELTDFDKRITARDGLLCVLNDEAHHTHDEENEWNKAIRQLHTQRSIAAQLDFSATPRYTKGALFAWTIADYPLKQAILDRIVKRPIKGISKIEEAKSDVARVRYAGFLTAGVERWKEYAAQLTPLKKKPILFIMLNSTDEADDITDWLQTRYPESFGDKKTLKIHTDRSGEVSKQDLEIARQAAREVDDDDSPINAIVSVLMLREGWDVQNVTVVVGLRPFASKSNILPEQAIGRGLRLMFRGTGIGYQERVDVIGNRAFLAFVEDLEKLEGLTFETYEIGKDKLRIDVIMPVDEKKAVDIAIPELTPTLVRKTSLADEIAAIDVMQFRHNPLPLVASAKDVKTFPYEGRDILTDETLLQREYTLPPAQTPEEVIGYYALQIAYDLKLPSQFAALAPKIREFFEKKAFGKSVDLHQPLVIKAMSTDLTGYVVCHEFKKALQQCVVMETQPQLETPARWLSSTPPFAFSQQLVESPKTVFNFVACDNKFEEAFAKFLHHAADVAAFAKLPQQFGFYIHYTDSRMNLRHYYPDFVVKLTNGEHWLLETKGMESVEVQLKDAAANHWCASATDLTGTRWNYLKVLQPDFEALHPETFEELRIAFL